MIYVSNCDIERKILWDDLSDIKAQASPVPWLVVGDFNVIKIVEERLDCFKACAVLGPLWIFRIVFLRWNLWIFIILGLFLHEQIK